jgi:biopolymer transport protein ExbD
MNFRRRHRQHTGVEASSLSDILFFLLLFFLMISTMASPDAIKLMLPQSTTSKHVPKETISLSMNARKEYFINGQRVDVADLETRLGEVAKAKNAETVVLRIDKDNTIQDMATIHDAIAKQNLGMVLATDR